MREASKPLRLVPSVHRATHRIALFLQAQRPALDVTQGEAHLLAQLASDAPCSIAELHAAFAHRRSTLTSILDRLAERRLIARGVNPADRRSFLVSLTPKGRALARAVKASLAELEARVLAAAPPEALAGFEQVTRALELAAAVAAAANAKRGAARANAKRPAAARERSRL